MKNAVILGATGYTGAEAVRLISGHPKINIIGLVGNTSTGVTYESLYPNFHNMDLPIISSIKDIDWTNVDVIFSCLPHGASQEVISSIYDSVDTIIDLSADFRLKDPDLYQCLYGEKHIFPAYLKKSIYGLTEFNRKKLLGAKLVACPGCYPTCSLLGLLPALESSSIDLDNIIIDAKSGVSGTGRKASKSLHFSEISDGCHAYSVANHRHAPEIEQTIENITGRKVKVSFTPHLIPMNRGMVATSYVKLADGVTYQDLRQIYQDRFKNEPFVILENQGISPHSRHIKGSNICKIALFEDRRPGWVIIISVIDNLTKGSAGQAIQNYNLTQGWAETLGLINISMFP
ncbi:MAG: N-acetyl-gamma-glutamyl-phosphate reductase [Hellea sp.]|nr:N-acetyl-gamma-glutamyl-phosphate reductase [Hellea sp.]